MNIAYLILGTNKGEREQNLNDALELLIEKVGAIPHKSDIFVTAPWGNPNQNDFYNQAICIHTELNAAELLESNLQIEEKLGRVRTEEKWMERTMDIDILFYNQEIVNQTNLIIPHPYIQERKFVLMPLAQIAGNLLHPILKKTINQLLLECKDQLQVIKKS